jgi:leucyl aminopeptidase (aminopeptidase T)
LLGSPALIWAESFNKERRHDVMRLWADEMEKRRILSEVALGNVPPDTIIKNGTLFNVFTREFIKT